MKRSLLKLYFESTKKYKKRKYKEEIIVTYYHSGMALIGQFLQMSGYTHGEPDDYALSYLKAMERALNSYDPKRAGFYAYFRKILHLEMFKEINEERRANALLFSAISLDEIIYGNEDCYFSECLCDDEEPETISYVEGNEIKRVLSDRAFDGYPKKLSKLLETQRKILCLQYYGFRINEICEMLSISRGQLRYALNKPNVKNSPVNRIKLLKSN